MSDLWRFEHCHPLTGIKLQCLLAEACEWTTCAEALHDDRTARSWTRHLLVASL